jgi:hypothetical protein
MTHKEKMLTIFAGIGQAGEPDLEEFCDTVLMRTAIGGAEVKVAAIPFGENVHDVVELE